MYRGGGIGYYKRRTPLLSDCYVPIEELTPDPENLAGPIRQVDALFGVWKYANHAQSRSSSSTVVVTAVAAGDDVDNFDTVMTDRCIVRVTGHLVHSDILGKVLTMVPLPLQGELVNTLSVNQPLMTQCGFAISPSGSQRVITTNSEDYDIEFGISNEGPDRVLYYSGNVNASASPLKWVRWPNHLSHFKRPPQYHGVCWHSSNTVLVAENEFGLVLQLNTLGELLRTLPVKAAYSICCNDSLIVVGTAHISYGSRDRNGMIVCLDYATGKIVKLLGALMIEGRVNQVRITTDNVHVLAATDATSLSLFRIADGAFVRSVCIGAWIPHAIGDFAIMDTNEIVICCYHASRSKLLVYTSDGSVLLRKVPGDEPRPYDCDSTVALSCANGALYCSQSNYGRILVFK